MLFSADRCKKIPLLGRFRRFFRKKWKRFLKLSARGPVWRFFAATYAKFMACWVRILRYLYDDRLELQPKQIKTVQVKDVTINSAGISWVPRHSSRFNVDKYRLKVRKICRGSCTMIKELSDEMLFLTSLATTREIFARKTKEEATKISEEKTASADAKAAVVAAAVAASAASIATTLTVVAHESVTLAAVRGIDKKDKDHTCYSWQTLYDGPDAEHTCTDLEEACRYEALIETYNSKGKSSPSKFPMKTMQIPVNNGGHDGGYLWTQAMYKWTQTRNEVEISVSVPSETKKKDIVFQQQAGELILILKGRFLITGTLQKLVRADGTFWEFQGEGKEREILITLQKANTNKWTSILKGGIEVDESMVKL